MSVAKMMRGHDLFRSLSFEDVERIGKFAAPKPFKKGETVFKRGAQGSHFFVVLEGRVNLKLPSSDEESALVVGRLSQGEIFGLSPLLGIERYTTTSTCAEDTTILAVEVAPFRRLLEGNATAGLHIMNVVARAYFTRYVDTLGRIQGLVDELASEG